MKLKTEKFYWEKEKPYKNRYQWHKIVCSSAWKWFVDQSQVSCHSINYPPKTIGDNCCTIVRLPSNVIVRWDYRPNPSPDAMLMKQKMMMILVTSLCCALL